MSLKYSKNGPNSISGIKIFPVWKRWQRDVCYPP